MIPALTKATKALSTHTCTAAAHPNLALVKYWGQADEQLMLPANSSISVNLSGATTVTTVTFDPAAPDDRVLIDDLPASEPALRRVAAHLDRVRALAGIATRALVTSRNDFPAAAGVASSASAFAALSLAATRAAGLELDTRALSILARKGSGSACRSVPDGFVEWEAGTSDETSYAHTIAPCGAWDLRVMTLTFGAEAKSVPSLEGHRAAAASPYYAARLSTLPTTLDLVRSALARRDLHALGSVAEREAVAFHAVAMTSPVAQQPWLSGIYYWKPQTLAVIRAVQEWRAQGLAVYFTLDAGPSIHLLCEARVLDQLRCVAAPLLDATDAGVIISEPGRGAWVLEQNEASDATCRV